MEFHNVQQLFSRVIAEENLDILGSVGKLSIEYSVSVGT